MRNVKEITKATPEVCNSIKTLLTIGRINDALVLVRKLFDDILTEIYLDVTLKDKF